MAVNASRETGRRSSSPAVRTAVEGVPVDSVEAARLRQGLVEALLAMLEEVRLHDLAAVMTDSGVSVLLEHDNVRCVLVVSPQLPRHTLSPRELQIAHLVADGATNRAIANSLEISLWTVSTHMRRIFAKMGVGSRAEMVAQFFGGADHAGGQSPPPRG